MIGKMFLGDGTRVERELTALRFDLTPSQRWNSETVPRLLIQPVQERLGLEFKALVDDTRRRFAVEYLKDSENTLTEIAFLLGYSEVSAFSRAFKRWTGITPVGYRRK
jgi:AraC-like DNA-binding protein